VNFSNGIVWEFVFFVTFYSKKKKKKRILLNDINGLKAYTKNKSVKIDAFKTWKTT